MKALFKNEIVNMVFVLGCICAAAGLALSGVYEITKGPIAETLLKVVMAPAVEQVFKGYDYDNNPLEQIIKIPIGKDKAGKPAFLLVFPAKKGDKTLAVAMESSAPGFGGDIKVMVGVDIEKAKYTGIAVVGHSETPGYGARMDTDEKFVPSFSGQSMEKALTADDIDGLSGATVTSVATVDAVNKVKDLVAQYKDQMLQ